MFDTINKRAINLSNLETKVKSIRASLSSDLPPQGEKAKLLSENGQLIDLAFHQEKNYIIEHSKLHISHDLSKLCKFKKYIQDIIDGKYIDFNYEEEEIKNKKKRIENLKNAIEYEKSRIFSMQIPQFEINEAARLIQKNWRGYYQRQQTAKHNNETLVGYENDNNEFLNQGSTNSEPIDDYCDNSDEDDVIGVFSVTGVANTENGNEDEDKTTLTPADALDNHKCKNKRGLIKNSNVAFQRKFTIHKNETRKNNKRKLTNNNETEPKLIKQGKQKIINRTTGNKIDIEPKLNMNESNLNQQNKEQLINAQNNAANTKPEERLKLENIIQSTDQNAKSPINIKTYMSD